MPIVTLTTDFGWQDYYLAMIKGAILSLNPNLMLVDLTHGIKNYDIVQTAFLFKNAWSSFPKGTIHLISVNDYAAPEQDFLATSLDGHYFIAPNNGLFSLIFDESKPTDYYSLPFDTTDTFPLKTIYSKAVVDLANGVPIENIGEPTTEVLQRITLQPVTSHSQIRGSFIYIDNYDNAVTNVNKELFDRIGGGRSFKLFFKRHDPITKLSKYYYDVPVGEPLCLFNSAGYIEVAINMGKASSMLSLKIEDTLQIDFHS